MHEVILDRREAINKAIEISLPSDIILIAGKGHETYQEVKGKRFQFDDREIARRALEEKRKRDEADFLKRQAEREEREKKRGPNDRPPRDYDRD